MKKSIAVDCDDVIVNTAVPTLDYYNRMYGTRVELKDFYSNDLSLWDAPDEATAVRRFDIYVQSSEFFELVPTQAAVETLGELAKYYELHIVTGRPSIVEQATLHWLEEALPGLFKSVIFTNYFVVDENQPRPRSKADVCAELGVDYLIDDHLHHAEVVAAAGIPVLLFGNYPWNVADQLPSGVRRVSGWSEVRHVLLADEN